MIKGVSSLMAPSMGMSGVTASSAPAATAPESEGLSNDTWGPSAAEKGEAGRLSSAPIGDTNAVIQG